MQLTILDNSSFQLLFKTARKQSLLILILLAGFGFNSFAQPANDEPCNAIPILASDVCNYQVFSNLNATASAGAPAPGCANYQGGDVWFQVNVVAASNGNLKFDTQQQTPGITDLGMAVYSGPDCNNLTLLDCDDDGGAGLMSQITLTGLTVGSTLWVRVWEYGGDNNGDFGICVKYPGPPPAYDDPCNATALPTPTTDCNYQTFTDEGATGSANVPAPGCANYIGGDVWFSVVVPAGGLLSFDTQTGEVINGGMAIYSGVDCNTLTLIACDDNSSVNGNMPKIVAGNLVPGSTIWIRFWSNGLPGNVGSFGICVSIPPPPPVNDEPCGAIMLTPSSTCNYQTFTTASSNPSAGAPAPGCANYQGGDVWFSVVVPCDGALAIDTQTGVVTDGGMAIYSGGCNNLTQIACNDDGSANGLMPYLSSTNLTPGDTILIRVWEYGNDNPGTFGICVSIPPPPPPGSNCFGAQPFCSSNTYTYPNSTNVPSLGGGGIYGCLGTTPNPAWYYLQVQNPGPMSIFIQQTSTAGNIVDVDYALWGPFPTVAAACGNLAASNIVSCSYSTSGTETATLPNGQTGDFYILLITNFSNQPGTVTFNQNGGSGSTSCDILCTLTSANSGPVCACGTVDLTSSLVVGATYQWTGPNCFNQTPESQTQNPTGVQVPCTPGTYIYTVTATTQSGTSCYSSDTVIVIAKPVLGNDTTVYICPTGNLDLTSLYNTTGLTSAWTNYADGTPVPNPASVNTAGIYQLVGINATNCPDTVLVTLVVDNVTSTVTATGIGTCTLPGEITVTNPVGVGSIFTYSISTAPGTFQTSNIFVIDPGTYTIITMDSLGCTTTSNPVTVAFNNDLTLAVAGDTTICLGASTTIYATSTAASYAWTPTTGLNDPTSASPIASPTESTTYSVTATLGSCTQTGSVIVNVDKDLVVDAGGPLFLDAGGSSQIQATVTGPNINLSSILWTPAAGLNATNILNPIVTPVITTGTATYDITVTNSAGCTATDQLIVNVLSNCITVRNAFTPNGDGVNDYWKVYDDFSCLSNVTVNVFNRYGSKVFESDNYRNTWDGHYSGKQLPDGTYYAVIEFKLLSGKTRTVKTDVTILR
ncbi:MAG: gliding motility-associated C-terminal domain-containing protein [Ferruginibacter sp.]